MTKKNFGWVLYDMTDCADDGLPGYCGSRYGSPYMEEIEDAYVYETRKIARQTYIVGTDRIRKVSLDSNGRPVAVIGRG